MLDLQETESLFAGFAVSCILNNVNHFYCKAAVFVKVTLSFNDIFII